MEAIQAVKPANPATHSAVSDARVPPAAPPEASPRSEAEGTAASPAPARRVIDARLEVCFDPDSGRVIMDIRSRRSGQLIMRMSQRTAEERWPIVDTRV